MSSKKAPYWYVHDVPIDQIDEFPDHPFRVEMDDDMKALIESIESNGLIDPLILRVKEDGRYEVIAGHRRKKACEYLGKTEVPAETRKMSREDATIMMVESNLHRSKILPSEKAFAYKMLLEAKKRQGKRTDLTSSPMETRLRASEVISKEYGDSRAQVDRYIRLTELTTGILDMVDQDKMGIRPALEISYLKKEEQEVLLDTMRITESTPTHSQAIKLRNLSENGKLSTQFIRNILSEEKPNQKEQIKVRYELASQYLPREMAFSDYESYILRALQFYRQYQDKHNDEPEL